MTEAKDGSDGSTDPLGLGDGTGEPKPRRARGAAKARAAGDQAKADAVKKDADAVPDDDLADDEPDDEVDDTDDEGADPAVTRKSVARSSRSGTGTKSADGRAARTEDSKVTARRDGREERVNVLTRIWRYYREIVAELRKVIWPTRRELVTYTTVVVIFVAIIVALVAGLDYGFAKLVLKVFG